MLLQTPQSTRSGGRDNRRSLIRVSALLRAGIHGRGYVVVSVAGDDRVVGVSGRTHGRRVDHRVRTARDGAAVDVVANRVSRGGPAEIHGVLGCRRSRTGHRLQGG